MKECEQVRENLSAYIDDVLNDTEKEQISNHLSSCRACAEDYELLQAVLQTAKNLPELSVSPDLHKRIMDGISKEAQRPMSKKFSLWKQASKFAAAAAVIAISLISLHSLPGHPELTIERTVNETANDEQSSRNAKSAAKEESAFDLYDYSSEGADETISRNSEESIQYRANQASEPAADSLPETENSSAASVPSATEESLTDGEQAPVAVVSDQSDTKAPIPTMTPGFGAGSAGGGSAKVENLVEYTFTEPGLAEAKALLEGFSYTNRGYAVPSAEYESLHQQLTKLEGFVSGSSVSVRPDIEVIYVHLFTE